MNHMSDSSMILTLAVSLYSPNEKTLNSNHAVINVIVAYRVTAELF